MIEAAAATAYRLPPWLIVVIVVGITGAVSAAAIVEETRTTSLLLSRWAAFLASLVMLLDVAAVGLVVAVAGQHLPQDGSWRIAAYIGIAGMAPSILRSLQVPVVRTSVGPFRPYEVLRRVLLVRLDDELATHMEIKGRLIARKAYGYGIDPKDLAHVMTALIVRKKATNATKAQLGHVLGALQVGDVEDQMERLAELMYEYRMRSLIRCIETGTITALLTPSRPVYLVDPDGEPPQRTDRATPTRAQQGKAARSRSSPRAPAPDPDPRAPDRSGRQEPGQGPQGS